MYLSGRQMADIMNMQCNAYGESPEEAVLNLQETMNEMIDEMYMVEEFI